MVSIPEDGQSTAVGGPGSVDAGTLVVFRNNTTGELVTVEANADGSFSVTGNAELGDDIDLLFIDASGNETEFEPENFENLDGAKLVDRRGATVSGPMRPPLRSRPMPLLVRSRSRSKRSTRPTATPACQPR